VRGVALQRVLKRARKFSGPQTEVIEVIVRSYRLDSEQFRSAPRTCPSVRWQAELCGLASARLQRSGHRRHSPNEMLWNVPPRPPGSIRFDAHKLHYLAPFLGFVGNELGASNPLDRCKRFQIIHPPFLDLAWRKGSFIFEPPSRFTSFNHLVGENNSGPDRFGPSKRVLIVA
jgi:hypothetical protein